MSDRLAQARAEAERRIATKRERLWDTEGEHLSHSWGAGFQAGFREGSEWADANQKPHTITRKELNTAMLRAPRGSGAAGVLAQLGIEVADDE